MFWYVLTRSACTGALMKSSTALQDELVAQGLIDEVQVLETSRIGGCSDGPEMMVYPEGVHYTGLTVDDIPYLVEEHFLKGRVVKKFLSTAAAAVDEELERTETQGSAGRPAQLRPDRPRKYRRLHRRRWLQGARQRS